VNAYVRTYVRTHHASFAFPPRKSGMMSSSLVAEAGRRVCNTALHIAAHRMGKLPLWQAERFQRLVAKAGCELACVYRSYG
jgi:hypothetical protein